MEKQAVAILVLMLFCGCEPANRYLGLEDDSPIEEIVEKAIEMKTGLDIDLTPTTQE